MTTAMTMVIVIGSFLTSGALADETERLRDSRLVEANGPVVYPHTDGEYVAWESSKVQNLAATDVLAVGINERDVFEVAVDDSVRARLESIDDGTVVWSESSLDAHAPRNIRAADLESGERVEVTQTESDESDASLVDGRLIWLSSGPDSQALLTRRIESDAEPEVISRSSDENRQTISNPEFDGEWVTWFESVPATGPDYPRHAVEWQLFSRNIEATATPRVLDEGVGSLPRVALADGYVITVNDEDFTRWFSLEGESNGTLPVELDYGSPPRFDGRYVIWTRQLTPLNVELRAFDWHTRSSFIMLRGDRQNLVPHLANGVITWQEGARSDVEIHASDVVDLLPSGAHAPLDADDSVRSYYPETAHNLVFGFKAFWEESGRLPVFGFPLTEEFDEIKASDRSARSVQYFERQRFEYHPEHAGTPYDVQLGRLGVEVAQRNHKTGTIPFQPHGEELRPDGDCDYFIETGHHVCDEFLDYWRSHGLEFGDADVSYRESLALFGYPISQPYEDPESGLLTQYFERARFEFHPENPEDHKVLLGRLGADSLAQRDW